MARGLFGLVVTLVPVLAVLQFGWWLVGLFVNLGSYRWFFHLPFVWSWSVVRLFWNWGVLFGFKAVANLFWWAVLFLLRHLHITLYVANCIVAWMIGALFLVTHFRPSSSLGISELFEICCLLGISNNSDNIHYFRNSLLHPELLQLGQRRPPQPGQQPEDIIPGPEICNEDIPKVKEVMVGAFNTVLIGFGASVLGWAIPYFFDWLDSIVVYGFPWRVLGCVVHSTFVIDVCMRIGGYAWVGPGGRLRDPIPQMVVVSGVVLLDFIILPNILKILGTTTSVISRIISML